MVAEKANPLKRRKGIVRLCGNIRTIRGPEPGKERDEERIITVDE